MSTMATDQLAKPVQQRTSPDAAPFLLSWTLTQQVSDMTKLTSIRDLGTTANHAIYQQLVPVVTKTTYPKIFNIADTISLRWLLQSGTSPLPRVAPGGPVLPHTTHSRPVAGAGAMLSTKRVDAAVSAAWLPSKVSPSNVQ